MKKIYFIFLLVLVFSLMGCTNPFDAGIPRDDIFCYVKENCEKLEKFPYDEMPQNEDGRKTFLKEYLGSDTIVKDVYAYNENVLSFYCGGSRIVTGSTYTGFYFSKNDTPFALDFDGCELVEVETGICCDLAAFFTVFNFGLSLITSS